MPQPVLGVLIDQQRSLAMGAQIFHLAGFRMRCHVKFFAVKNRTDGHDMNGPAVGAAEPPHAHIVEKALLFGIELHRVHEYSPFRAANVVLTSASRLQYGKVMPKSCARQPRSRARSLFRRYFAAEIGKSRSQRADRALRPLITDY